MATESRKISRVIQPEWTMEGAGVKLKRSIATSTLDYLDPFLLFDHFGSDDPADYLAGFPMHPHRGIETVTYMLAGNVNHKDSLGNSGNIQAGDIQWMTAGRGILHEEMPRPTNGKMEGFQLWVNLPAQLKMTAPRYQGILANETPETQAENGVRIRVIAGRVGAVSGAVTEIYADPDYLDITMPANAAFTHPIARGHSAFAYIFEGAAKFEEAANANLIPSPRLVVWSDGDQVRVTTGVGRTRFLLVSGKPLHEPIARYGPFVMNTREEILQALVDLRNGTFVRD
jgi:redox-sensitive bicupin YhaK (pirin superfamily)